MNESPHAPADPLSVALNHRCPACQNSSLYSGILTLKDKCDGCNLALNEHDVGDGPAFFAISILGFIVVGIALAIEVYLHPPYWVHAVAVVLSTLILTPISLRFFKSYLIALKYKHHWSQELNERSR